LQDRTIKGFAFIEYAEPESADAAAKGPVTYKDGNTDHTVKVLHKYVSPRSKRNVAMGYVTISYMTLGATILPISSAVPWPFFAFHS
jgi:hypothetical protein